MGHSQRRYTTVHDKAALRLHPDGTRAASSSNRPTLITRDTRGNVFATDSSGPFKAKQRRRAAQSENDEGGESFDLDAVNSASDDEDRSKSGVVASTSRKAAGKRKASTENGESDALEPPPNKSKKRKLSKAARRKHFEDDYSFLNPPLSLPSPGGASHPPNPSPDLLKAIHHFASRYYDEMGQLNDATRTTRYEDRQRKKQKRLGRSSAGSSNTRSRPRSKRVSPVEGDDDSAHEDQDEDMRQDSDEEEDAEEEEGGGGHDAQGKKRKFETRRSSNSRNDNNLKPRDMYKAFDGTALVVIGMLVQQFITDTLNPSTSSPQHEEDWQSEMLAWNKKHKKQKSKEGRSSETARRPENSGSPCAEREEEDEQASQVHVAEQGHVVAGDEGREVEDVVIGGIGEIDQSSSSSGEDEDEDDS